MGYAERDSDVLVHQPVVDRLRIPGDRLPEVGRPGSLVQQVVGENQDVAAVLEIENVLQLFG